LGYSPPTSLTLQRVGTLEHGPENGNRFSENIWSKR
jgi:hypothetical protein